MDTVSTTAAGCPSDSELTQFITGNLSGNTFARISRHVESCPTCEKTLGEVDDPQHPFLSQLRTVIRDSSADEGVPPALLDAAKSVVQGVGESGEPSLPRKLGKFELLEELGFGSFGQVYRARDNELGRTVAIKMLRAGRLAGRDEVDRFLREARSAAQLQHPGLVALFETGQTDEGVYYLVEEFVEGETLAARLRTGPFGFRNSADLIARIADALDFAHRHGIVHRDVKPSNIQLDREGRPHLMDFGLAKQESDEALMTISGQVLGTPAYVSPEQARGESHLADGRTDVYSLGVILYEMLTGERPFRGNRQMLFMQVLNDEPRAPRQLNDKIPRDLETICLKAIAKAPARRYQSAREMAEDLRRFLVGEPIKARPLGRLERIWRWCRLNPVPAGLLLAVTLGSAFGLWELSRLSEYLVRKSALESAAQQSEILDEVNNMYSADVVERVERVQNSEKFPKKIAVSHDYATRGDAIPLPATLTIDLARHISSRSESGVQVRLYSDYPFKFRKDGGPKDDFEREALKTLRQRPSEPFYRFEDFQGRPSLRYATARRMQQTCINCHNHDENSTFTHWVEGDVRGVLEIIRPLDRDADRAREGLRRTLILMAAISAGLLGLTVFVLVVGRRRRSRFLRSNE